VRGARLKAQVSKGKDYEPVCRVPFAVHPSVVNAEDGLLINPNVA